MTTRVNYTMTPNLSVQVYAQPFVSSGNYAQFKELVNGRALDYDDRYAPYRLRGHRTSMLSFRTTNVMRWEYQARFNAVRRLAAGARRSGQRRTASSYGQDFGDVFATASSNALLVKLAYWLNP